MSEDTVTETGENIEPATPTEDTQATVENVDTNGEQPSVQTGYDLNTVKFPEGVQASDEDKTLLSTTIDSFGIKSQEGVQAFVDWMFKAVEDEKAKAAENTEAEKKKWEEIKSGWKTSLESDAEFGKEYDANIKRAQDTIARFGGSELSSWLKDADLADHPALLKTFARIGKEIEDAKLLVGNKGIETNKVKRDRYNQPMLVYKD